MKQIAFNNGYEEIVDNILRKHSNQKAVSPKEKTVYNSNIFW